MPWATGVCIFVQPVVLFLHHVHHKQCVEESGGEWTSAKKRDLYILLFFTLDLFAIPFTFVSFNLNHFLLRWTASYSDQLYSIRLFIQWSHFEKSRTFHAILCIGKSILNTVEAALLSLLEDLVLIRYSWVRTCVFVQRILKHKHNENENTFEHSGTMNNIILHSEYALSECNDSDVGLRSEGKKKTRISYLSSLSIIPNNHKSSHLFWDFQRHLYSNS